MFFRYKTDWFKTEDDKDIGVKKPRLEVVLRKFSDSLSQKDNPEYRAFATVDSGADFTFIPIQVAEILGLDFDENNYVKIMTIVGISRAYKAQVHLDIMYKKKQVPIGMIDVLIAERDGSQAYIQSLFVLGRNGFFDKFEITFNEYEKNFTLKKYHPKETERR